MREPTFESDGVPEADPYRNVPTVYEPLHLPRDMPSTWAILTILVSVIVLWAASIYGFYRLVRWMLS